MTTTLQPLPLEICVIPANPTAVQTGRKNRQLRVAAYCRVSTDQEEQQSSYEAQIEYYTDKIVKNPEWTLVDIYADEGITGTSAHKRPRFLKMIEHCKKGKIDMILTKSISRFARNTLDCLNYIRMLKELNIPVIFEKEGINTMKMASEMAITMMGCFAQAESESISQNVTWGKRQSFKNGKVTFNYANFLGYKKGENDQPEIDQEQAETVRRIFNMYLAGYSMAGIKQELESDGVLTAAGKSEWSQAGISSILRNEKYTGNSLLQKTFVADVLTKKIKKNNGELPKYLIKNSHPSIIAQDIFDRVQEEIARRNSKRKASEKNTVSELGRYSSKYALTELLICGDCGTPYKRVTWSRNGKKKIVWRCTSRLDYGTKYCKQSPTLEEHILQDAILRALQLPPEDRNELASTIKQNLQIAMSGKNEEIDVIAIKHRIKELNDVTLDLVNISIKSGTAAECFEDKFIEISDEVNKLQEILRQYESRHTADNNLQSKMNEVSKLLATDNLNLTEYDDQFVRQVVDTIKVVSGDKILIILKGGIEIEQPLWSGFDYISNTIKSS